MASKLVPNSFQHPNFYIDRLAHYLTPQEQVVLSKATREILGWHNKIESRRARIALSVFEKGKFRRDTGERLCWGCGLGTGALRAALKALDEFGILIKIKLVSGEKDITSDGQLFYLSDDENTIKWDKLEARHDKNTAKGRARIAKAREVLSSNGGTVGQKEGGSVEQKGGGTVGQKERNPRKPKETQLVADATKVESAGEELVEQYFGPRETPKQEPTKSTGDWRGRLKDNPHLAWAAESEEAQAQLQREDGRGDPMRILGYGLDTDFGLRPVWAKKKDVGSWFRGLAACLDVADDDAELVLTAAWQLLEGEMTVSDPWSLVKKTRALAAERRRPQGASGAFFIGV